MGFGNEHCCEQQPTPTYYLFMKLKSTSYLAMALILTCQKTPAQNSLGEQCTQKEQSATEQIATCQQAIAANRQQTNDLIKYSHHLAAAYQANQQYVQSNQVLTELQNDYPNMVFADAYLTLRTLGLNHYYLHQYSQAQQHFQKALLLATNQADLFKVSQSHNDLGIIFKLQSRYTDALKAYSESLRIKQSLKLTTETASTLYNIGNVYILINDQPSAFDYHQQALTIYSALPQDNQRTRERVIHIKDQIARSLAAMGDTDLAITYLSELIDSTAELPDSNELSFESRCNLAELYLETNQADQALTILQQTTVTEHITDSQKAVQLEMYARTYLSLGSIQLAAVYAARGLALTEQNNEQEQATKFLALLAVITESNQQYQVALEHQKKYIAYQEAYLKERYDSQIKYLQNDIELQQKQQQLMALENNNMIQKLTIKQRNYLIGIAALIGLGLLMFIFWYIKKKAVEKKQLMAAINSHKNELLDMQQEQNRTLNNMLGPLDEALICINQSNRIIYVNQSFATLLGQPMQQLYEQKLATILPDLSAALASYPMGKDDLLANDQQHQLPLNTPKLQSNVWLSQLHNFEDLLILSFQDQHLTEPSKTAQFINQANKYQELINKLSHTHYSSGVISQDMLQQLDSQLKTITTDANGGYRQALVDLMYANLEIWRAATNGDRISLAEQSGAWKVTIDDGRLRTRAMDRYLSLKLLPKVPRWRPIVKTSHYILSSCDLTDKQRKHLNALLDAVTNNLKQQSTAA